MRLWSINPTYLDTKGLLAVWREGLLARKVLQGKTKGYKKHPQLLRFREQEKPVEAIDSYLSFIYNEAKVRGYKFDVNKIQKSENERIIPVTKGQIEFETMHLLEKLRKRDPVRYERSRHIDLKNIEPNPIFYIIDGEIETWEKI